MEPIDAHLLAQTILYFLIFVCGFIISIPLGVSQVGLWIRNKAQMWVLPYVITNTVMALMSFIAACMISVGFKKFCNGLLKNHEYYTHCSDAEGSEWHNEDTGKHFHPGHYYRMMNISQIACWIVFLLWVAQLALGFLRFFRNRKLLPKGTQSASPAISTII
ncbi:uncharacterized protein LOC127732749 [Mytilus californianus]|uniref:uncharacterized protein LOC127732749 n=1 Tax=Mytilus californianus TaxID=6549 RepID=UPI002245227F|nr:uncharacterized protein LOC127732749 [Mytilus californianus]